MSAVREKRRRAPRGQGERLREEILDAAERLLVQTGDEEAVSIRAVADAVGVTPPSIYLHFSDKNELMFAVCERQFERLDRVLEEAAASEEGPLDSLRARGRAYVRFGVESPEHYRILFMGKAGNSPADLDPERLATMASFDHLVDAVKACMDAGRLPPGDQTLVALGLWAVVHGITSLMISKPDFPWPDRDAFVDYLCEMQIRGLGGLA
jgi:AcrR family transcriptional regulator